jgi:hypothetical protein
MFDSGGEKEKKPKKNGTKGKQPPSLASGGQLFC